MAWIYGSKLFDDIDGTVDNDAIFGLAGDDVIRGSDGSDYIHGGRGWDTVDYSGYAGRLSIQLQATGESTVYGDGVASDRLVSIEQVIGGSGDDYFVGNAGDNVFFGGDGHDYFVASQGYDRYFGDCGYDMVDYSNVGTGLKIAPTGAGTATASSGHDGFDILVSIENIIGTSYKDVIVGDGADNFFRGIGGNDRLSGGAGGDVLNGGCGNDCLTGGCDADIFEFDGRFGKDVILDFDAHGDDQDRIDLSGVGHFACFDDLMTYNARQQGHDVVIDAGRSGSITLRNVDLDHLTAEHFLF